MANRKVCYFYDQNIGSFHYSANHPMKPFRIRMTDALVSSYGLYDKLRVYRPTPASFSQITRFHTDDYIKFLQSVAPDTILESEKTGNRKFNFGDDCPPFEGIYDFSCLSAGGSIDGANMLADGKCDIAINWGGGLHHAKKTEASGFCYVNDIVLAILELLKTYNRILYLDVDVHHGDGVEEAFYTTDRVMTVSFHMFGNGFFPGTGSSKDVGAGKGKNYAVNVPLLYGIDDETYHSIFQPVIRHVMNWYKPSVVVLQLGADSLAGDRLGMFNLSMRGHAKCVEFLKSFHIPLLMLGGGGYTIRNVARAWTFETATALGVTLDHRIPFNEFMDYYGPAFVLDVPATNINNCNSVYYISSLKHSIFDRLRDLPFAPSVQMSDKVNLRWNQYDLVSAFEDCDDPDIRLSDKYKDSRIANPNELWHIDFPREHDND